MTTPADTTARLATAYAVAGAGAPVVLIHGLGEDHRSWRAQQAALREYRTIAYDIRGHGLTPIGEPDGTLAQLGQDLVDLIERSEGPCALVGFSLGGTIAVWLAAHRPELVTRMVLLGTSAVVGRRAAAAYRETAALVAAGDRDALVRDIREGARAGIHRQDVDVDGVVADELDAIGDGSGYANAALAMARLNDEPLTELLREVRCPTLVASGEFDAFCPAAAQQTLLDNLEDARYVTIEGAAHYLHADAPDAVTEVLRGGLEVPAAHQGATR